jgi:hypothetical protein
MWLTDLESLMRDLILSSTESLSLWNALVDGQVYNAAGEIQDSKILMAYYFNLGIDAEVGIEVERQRSNRRICNYMKYIKVFLYKYFCRKESLDVRNTVKSISSTKTLPNGL